MVMIPVIKRARTKIFMKIFVRALCLRCGKRARRQRTVIRLVRSAPAMAEAWAT